MMQWTMRWMVGIGAAAVGTAAAAQEIVDVQVQSAAVEPGAAWGHWHPALVHFPLGLLLAAVVVAAWSWRRRAPLGQAVLLAGLALAAMVLAAATGWAREEELEALGSLTLSPDSHRLTMLASTALVATAVAVGLARRKSPTGAVYVAFTAGVALAFVLAVVGAHLGGILVYGPDFLPF